MLRVHDRAPFSGRHVALPYQAEAVRVTKDLEYAALFHEQGLGKTKMALDLVLHWLASSAVDSVVVVTKKALVENWERETRFHTYLRPIRIGQDRRENFYAFNRPGRLYLCHYEVMHSERGRFQLFAKARRLGVLLDEAATYQEPKISTRCCVARSRPISCTPCHYDRYTCCESPVRSMVSDLLSRYGDIAWKIFSSVQVRDES